MNVLLVGTGDADLRALVGDGSHDVARYASAADRAALAPASFDAAVLLGFPDGLPRPAELLRDVADLLAAEGRVIVEVARIARPAVRAAVFKGSDGEHVAPLVTERDVSLYADRSVTTLLEEAGMDVVAADAARTVLEGRRARPNAHASPATDTGGRAAHHAASETERLAHCERELAELRAFFTTIHDGQRRLHEEGARLRALLANRERDLERTRAELDEVRGRPSREAELRERLDAARDEAAQANARVADLEARVARLRAALAELRERAG